MTYQEFIRCYPWIDLLLELFKGIMPTIVALLAIFLNNSFNEKRELMHRKKEMEFEYLEKVLNWLHEVKNFAFEASRAFNNALSIRDPKKRIKKCNEAIKIISKMNTSVASWNDTYNDMTKTLGYDLKLDEFKQSINNYSKKLWEIENKYINIYDKDALTNEINEAVRIFKSNANVSATLIIEKINLLL